MAPLACTLAFTVPSKEHDSRNESQHRRSITTFACPSSVCTHCTLAISHTCPSPSQTSASPPHPTTTPLTPTQYPPTPLTILLQRHTHTPTCKLRPSRTSGHSNHHKNTQHLPHQTPRPRQPHQMDHPLTRIVLSIEPEYSRLPINIRVTTGPVCPHIDAAGSNWFVAALNCQTNIVPSCPPKSHTPSRTIRQTSQSTARASIASIAHSHCPPQNPPRPNPQPFTTSPHPSRFSSTQTQQSPRHTACTHVSKAPTDLFSPECPQRGVPRPSQPARALALSARLNSAAATSPCSMPATLIHTIRPHGPLPPSTSQSNPNPNPNP